MFKHPTSIIEIKTGDALIRYDLDLITLQKYERNYV